MTNTDLAVAKLLIAQDAFDPIAREADHARHALKRSKSKANLARYAAAMEAFEAALATVDAAHAAVDAAEVQDAADLAAHEAKAAAAVQPSLF